MNKQVIESKLVSNCCPRPKYMQEQLRTFRSSIWEFVWPKSPTLELRTGSKSLLTSLLTNSAAVKKVFFLFLFFMSLQGLMYFNSSSIFVCVERRWRSWLFGCCKAQTLFAPRRSSVAKFGEAHHLVHEWRICAGYTCHTFQSVPCQLSSFLPTPPTTASKLHQSRQLALKVFVPHSLTKSGRVPSSKAMTERNWRVASVAADVRRLGGNGGNLNLSLLFWC